MSYETLKKQIKSDKLQNMFHFYGEEVYLKQHYLGILKEKLSGEFPEFNFVQFEGEVSVQDIDVSFNTPPMMSDKKLVIFKDTGIFKAGSKVKEALKDAIENAADYLYVIVYDDEFDRRNTAYKAFAAKCLSVDFERRGRADIKAWVVNLLKKGRKRISIDAMEYFLDCVGVDMYSVLTDVNKLISYMGERDLIERQDVEHVITKEFFTKEYILTDALIGGDKKGAMKALDELLQMRSDPIMLLYIISSGYISTFKAKLLMDEGGTAAQITRQLSLPRDFLAKKYMDFARKLTVPKLKRSINLIKKADYDMKIGASDSETIIKMLVASL